MAPPTAKGEEEDDQQQQPLDYLYTVKSMYLGSEPMGELLEGENGSDVIQVPLKRTILRTNGIGKECRLLMTSDALLVKFGASSSSEAAQQQQQQQNQQSQQQQLLRLPIDMLAYCGALRQLPYEEIKTREFETLDKSPPSDPNLDPPLFVTIFRSEENENTLYCHSFVIRRDDEAMDLVKLVMEVYYNLIRLHEALDEEAEARSSNNSSSSTSSSSNSAANHEPRHTHGGNKAAVDDVHGGSSNFRYFGEEKGAASGVAVNKNNANNDNDMLLQRLADNHFKAIRESVDSDENANSRDVRAAAGGVGGGNSDGSGNLQDLVDNLRSTHLNKSGYSNSKDQSAAVDVASNRNSADGQAANDYLTELLNIYNQTPVTNNGGGGGGRSNAVAGRDAPGGSTGGSKTSSAGAGAAAATATATASGKQQTSKQTIDEMLQYLEAAGNKNSACRTSAAAAAVAAAAAAASTSRAAGAVSANEIIRNNLDLSQYELLVEKSGGASLAAALASRTGTGAAGSSNGGTVAVASDDCDAEVDKYAHVPLNSDDDPIIIKKENNEQLVYKQNVFIRWLQPPTPPPPAPIIIREVQEPAEEPLPPLVIYKQAPRPDTPPPLVIRERPPTPIEACSEPLIIERRVEPSAAARAARTRAPRKIIIEHLPAPPARPRDIILEKWLPSEAAPPRTVYIEKTNGSSSSSRVSNHNHSSNNNNNNNSDSKCYEAMDQIREQRPRRDLYDVLDKRVYSSSRYQPTAPNSRTSSRNAYLKHGCGGAMSSAPTVRRSNSSDEIIYCSGQPFVSSSNSRHLYSPHQSFDYAVGSLVQQQSVLDRYQPNKYHLTTSGNGGGGGGGGTGRVTGYRIIRQIIPGPNTTEADIERALARSQCVSTSYAPHHHANVHYSQHRQHHQHQQQHYYQPHHRHKYDNQRPLYAKADPGGVLVAYDSHQAAATSGAASSAGGFGGVMKTNSCAAMYGPTAAGPHQIYACGSNLSSNGACGLSPVATAHVPGVGLYASASQTGVVACNANTCCYATPQQTYCLPADGSCPPPPPPPVLYKSHGVGVVARNSQHEETPTSRRRHCRHTKKGGEAAPATCHYEQHEETRCNGDYMSHSHIYALEHGANESGSSGRRPMHTMVYRRSSSIENF